MRARSPWAIPAIAGAAVLTAGVAGIAARAGAQAAAGEPPPFVVRHPDAGPGTRIHRIDLYTPDGSRLNGRSAEFAGGVHLLVKPVVEGAGPRAEAARFRPSMSVWRLGADGTPEPLRDDLGTEFVLPPGARYDGPGERFDVTLPPGRYIVEAALRSPGLAPNGPESPWARQAAASGLTDPIPQAGRKMAAARITVQVR